jgi:hypothetical protein
MKGKSLKGYVFGGGLGCRIYSSSEFMWADGIDARA